MNIVMREQFLIKYFGNRCLNISMAVDSFTHKGMEFHILAPCVSMLAGLTSSLSWVTCRSLACRVFWAWISESYTYKLWKLGILSCRHWHTKIHVIYTLISVTDNKLFAAIRGSVWTRYGEHVIIRINFFCTHTMLSKLVLYVFPHTWLQ